jgi:hypothetical protein
MPWKCPACQTTLNHADEIPVPKRLYRCPVCHLELVFDLKTTKLVLAPLLEKT